MGKNEEKDPDDAYKENVETKNMNTGTEKALSHMKLSKNVETADVDVTSYSIVVATFPKTCFNDIS